MATLDDSPSLFSGQQWTEWAENVLSDLAIDDDDSPKKETEKIAADSMKLRKEDMPLFGLCPSQDEFYLVVCEKCNQVLKPQAFQRHLETRHGGREYHASKLTSSSRQHASKKSPSKSAHLHSSPHKNNATATFKSHRTSSSTSSVKEPPPSLHAELKVGARTKASKHGDSKIKKKHSIPVVEVERMPELTVIKKEKNIPSSTVLESYLTNGAVNTESRVKLEEPIQELEIKDFKPPISPHPALSAPPSPTPNHTSPLPLSPALASEVDTAVSSILEPVSEAETEIETSSIAIATPSVTMTTTTLTTASITNFVTSVTNVTTTMSTSSVFSYSGKLRLGGSHFNLGNISYSDTGVLRTLNADVDNRNNNSNKNNNSVFLLKTNISSNPSSPMKSTLTPSNKSFTSVKSSCSISGNLVINTIVSSSSAKTNVNVPPVVTSPPVVNIITSTSPAFKPNFMKSFSAAGKLIGSGKSQSHRTGTGLKSGLSSEELMKKYPDIEKPEKIIPLKDREYDPNKHCGVVIAETGKACTRSLTCKSHALSLRRAVGGRRLPFDELLQEHREAKDAYLLAKKGSSSSKPSTEIQKPKAHLIANMSNSIKENKLVPGIGHMNQKTTLGNTGVIISRPSLSNLHIPSPSIRMDDIRSPPDKPPGKLLTDDEEEKEKDDSYVTHHPRPISVCSFGARYHSGYNGGFGCHTFGRKTDHLRSALMDMLDKHIHPPPPKKLCVESNLPREAESQLNNKDPYDFGMPRGSQLQGIPVQRVNAVITSVPNKMIVKPKPNISRQNSAVSLNINKSKSRESSFGTSSTSLPSTPVLNTGTSSAKKRRGSGSGAVISGAVTNASGLITSITTPMGTSQNLIGTVGTMNVNSSIGNNPSFAIAIPSVISAKQTKNNLGFVVAGIPHDAILNGQCVNITSGPISDMNSGQVTLEDQSGQAHVINPAKTTPTKYINSINSIEAIRAIHKNNLITNLPPNTLLVEGGLQPGTVLAPVSITTPAVTNQVPAGGHAAFSPPQSPSPSPLVRSGSVSPPVSHSPLPNGVVASPADKESLLSQRHPVFQTKGPPPAGNQRGNSHQSHGPINNQSQSFSFTNPAPNSSANQISASQVFATPFTQLQVKNSNIHQKQTTNKLTMQPVSLTIPQASLQSLGGINVVGQRQTHTLYITSEEAQKQGLHLPTAEPQITNSPSDTLIS